MESATSLSLVREISQHTIDRYGQINGDNDIIHYDHDYALKRGFRGTLAHGLMVMGYAAELGARNFGEDWYTRGKLRMKWVKPVCPGDSLTVSADPEGNVEARNADETVMVGELSVVGE